jgi:DNA-binding MarR family transcriptional regulator
VEIECYCTTLRAATRRITAVYDAALEPAGVNAAQFGLLRRLSSGPLSIQQLAVAAELERSTVARNVRVLERSGLITLTAGSEDRRTTVIRLSERGSAALRMAAPLWESAQHRVEERLGAEAAVALRTTLQTL